MKNDKEISASVISRLPRYYRFLCELQKNGVSRISSNELSKIMGLTASQIRQDFNCFGGFGQQGYGYTVEKLKNEMRSILGLHTLKSAILIGAGNLGKTIASQLRFEELGFRLTAIFDSAPERRGDHIRGLKVKSDEELADFCRSTLPQMAILCLPEDKAPEIVDELIALGVQSFWNFSHYDIRQKYPQALVENVHMSDSLMTLSFIINNSKDR